MTPIERGFVPLPKVEQEQPEENIQILLNLPDYVDQDRIGVNLAGIAKLCKLGGIKQLIVIGSTNGETSHVVPQITGLDSEGRAVASRNVAKVTFPTFEMNAQNSNWRNTSISTRARNLTIDVNVNEIALRVSDKPEGIHSVLNWTKELDNGLRSPIRKAGNQNLLHGLEESDRVVRACYLGFWGTTAGLLLLNPNEYNPAASIFAFTAVGGFLKMVELIELRRHPDYRYSLFSGPQVDRAIALGLLSRMKTLIKDLSSG